MTAVGVEPLFDTVQGDDLQRRIGLVVAEMHKQPGWPVDEAKDRALARELIEQFPRLNLPAVLTAWRQWMADNRPKPGKRVNMRVRVVTWCSRERVRPAARTTGLRRDGVAGRRSGTAPCGPADFDGIASSL